MRHAVIQTVGRQNGVSLVEALVALAVMAVGMLGVVGMQATLRTNADVSRQRSEAVRMAQEKIEQLRSFAVLDGAPSGEQDYTAIANTASEEVTPSSGRTSATFKRTVTVLEPSSSAAQVKTVKVEVQWWDRRANASDTADPNVQSVVMTTTIAPVDPALGASLSLPINRSATQRPTGRHLAIPSGAQTVSATDSTFSPPRSSGTTWTFDNHTGMIFNITGFTEPLNAVLLSGYIRFATDVYVRVRRSDSRYPTSRDSDSRDFDYAFGQPSSADAETPPGSAVSGVGIAVTLTTPAPGTTDFGGQCFTGTADSSGAVPYYCALPLGQLTRSWSGRSNLTGLPLATSASDPSPTAYRVCRYTPNPSTDTPGSNAEHPLDYANVGGPLTDQNFLVIRAGDGTTAFTCPTDDSSTPLVDGDTRRHQPVS